MGGSKGSVPARNWASWRFLPRLKRMIAGHVVPRSGANSAAQLAHADPPPGRPCVLVVDDDPVNQMVASEMLSSLGIKPLLAADGAEAAALACELSLDLILMDLQMPVLDGLAATRQIRRFEREHCLARVPVVAYTSRSANLDQPCLRDCGVDAVLDKPCDAHALQQCLLRWCLPTGESPASQSLGVS